MKIDYVEINHRSGEREKRKKKKKMRAKKQWAPAIFSTAILLGTNIPWVGQKKNLTGDTLYLCK